MDLLTVYCLIMVFAYLVGVWVLNTKKTLGIYVLCAIPILFYLFIINYYRINSVWADDIDVLLVFYQTIQAETWQEKLGLLFEQHNDHRIVFSRMLFYGQYLLTKKIDLQSLMQVGDITLLLLSYLFYLIFKEFRLPRSYILPIPFILFGLLFFPNNTWCMAFISNIPVQLFVLSTFYWAFVRKNILIASVFAVLSSFTMTTGLISLFIVALLLFYQNQRKNLFYWVSVSTGILLIFFYHFEKLVSPNLKSILLNFPSNISYILMFLGQVLQRESPQIQIKGYYVETILSIILGLAIIGIFARLIYNYFNEKIIENEAYNFLIASFLFYFGCAIMSLVVLLPSHIEGIKILKIGEINFFTRYAIHSVMILITAYICLLVFFKNDSRKQEKVAFWGFSFFVFLNLSGYFDHFAELVQRHEAQKLDSFYLKMSNVKYSHLEREGYYIHNQGKRSYDSLFLPLAQRGVLKENIAILKNSPFIAQNLIDTSRKIDVTYKLINNPYVKKIELSVIHADLIGLVLKHGKEYLPLSFFQKKNSFREFFIKGRYFSREQYALVPDFILSKKKYQLLGVSSNNVLIDSKLFLDGETMEVK